MEAPGLILPILPILPILQNLCSSAFFCLVIWHSVLGHLPLAICLVIWIKVLGYLRCAPVVVLFRLLFAFSAYSTSFPAKNLGNE